MAKKLTPDAKLRRKEYRRSWYLLNAARIKSCQKAERDADPERARSRARAYYASKKADINAKRRAWRVLNRDKEKALRAKNRTKKSAQYKRWLQKNRAHKQEKLKLWRATNKDKDREQKRRWREKHREAIRAKQNERRKGVSRAEYSRAQYIKMKKRIEQAIFGDVE